MIPVRDTAPSQNHPVVNSCIIGINVVVYLVQQTQGGGLDQFIYTYGLVPARYSIPHISQYFSLEQQVFSLLSFMFLHGGFWHLLGNMWSLYIFGDNVEDRLGHFRYLLFYLLCGWLSGLTHLFFNLQSTLPTIGASGAIAGVMGAYVLLHPNARILTIIPIIFIPWFIEIPAFVFLGFWFVMQFINAAADQGGSGGIAWWAHIGGFVFGMVCLKLFLLFPRTGLSNRIEKVTARRKTHRLQVVHPADTGQDAHLYATIDISPFESLVGTRKLVNIPWGFHKRLIRVNVPQGIQAGNKLRLKGLGKITPDGGRGDLYLKVKIKD